MGTPFVREGQNSVRAFTVQGHVMLDISQSVAAKLHGSDVPIEAFTALELTELKDYWIAWGFMSGTAAGLEELKNTRVDFFSTPAASPKPQ